jgi:hypothetical protein
VAITADLGWTGGDPDGGHVVTYDVYFEAGDGTPDALICDDATTAACDPGTLAYGTPYYWYVVARDEHGASTTGSTWEFHTEVHAPGHIVSDPSWRYSEAMFAGWETHSFDDASWPSVLVPTAGPCPADDPACRIPGSAAEPMWSPNEVQEVYLRRTFTITDECSAGCTLSATVRAKIDDDYDLYVNEVLVGSNWDGEVNGIEQVSVGQYLLRGRNVLAIRAVDYGGCRYATVDLAISMEHAGGHIRVWLPLVMHVPGAGGTHSLPGAITRDAAVRVRPRSALDPEGSFQVQTANSIRRFSRFP